ncbi:MAG: site-2 protease family protein [Clostridia bacterium]
MFNFNFDRKAIIIVIAIMLVAWVISAGADGILGILLSLPGVIIAMTFHEYAHALAAYKLGDDTPKIQGRLNLNPINHIDPIGLVLLVVAGFGWGKPVQIDSRNFDGKYSLSKAEAIVAAAGPIMNFVLAFVFSILYYILFVATDILSGLSANTLSILYTIMIQIILINIGLGVFNLIPLPPLDGSKVLMHFLGYNAKQWFYRNEKIFYIAFLLLWVTGLLSSLLSPIFSGVFSGITWLAYKIVSIFI